MLQLVKPHKTGQVRVGHVVGPGILGRNDHANVGFFQRHGALVAVAVAHHNGLVDAKFVEHRIRPQGVLPVSRLKHPRQALGFDKRL